jgi:hypothetical protein
MAKRSTSPPPQSPQLSPQQMRTAIARFRHRLGELEKFDPTAVQDRSDPKIRTLEVSIEETLVEAFGHPAYQRYASATNLDKAGINLAYGTPLHEIIEGLIRGKAEAVALLNQAINFFEERIAEIGHRRCRIFRNCESASF